MLRIDVLAVGDLKERFYREACEEYAKRLGRYCKFRIIQIDETKKREGMSPAEENAVRSEEARGILHHVQDGARVITLEIGGKTWDSVSFARHLDALASQGVSHLQFVIGGPIGLGDEILARADERLSFSAFTFPHTLMRVILLEQIYRAQRISHGEPYHK